MRMGRFLGQIEQPNLDIEANWSLHPGSNGDELITNQPFYHYNYRGNLKYWSIVPVLPWPISAWKADGRLMSQRCVELVVPPGCAPGLRVSKTPVQTNTPRDTVVEIIGPTTTV